MTSTPHPKLEATSHDDNPSAGFDVGLYGRFLAMIATSTAFMFGLTYTNTYAAGHVRFSEERRYMALLMGAAMAVVMLGFMWRMHETG